MASSQELLLGTGTAVNQYQIQRSLRFDSAASAYLSRTTWGTPTNRKKGTISFWVKRSEIGSSSRYLVYSYNGSANNSFGIYFVSDNTLEFQFGGSSAKNIRTNSVFRDPSAWYHVVFAWDTTDATPANRTKIYVNNVEQALGTTNYPSQNDDAQFPATTDNYIGYTSSITLGGYLTESYFIDGSALTPSSFGETDTDTGVWKPKAYTGTYGTNGFYLNFSDNSNTTSTTLGKDSSGNGNNWTPSGFSVAAGVGNDSLVDTPTPYGTDTGAGGEVRGNYATLNPLITPTTMTIVNGNLDLSGYTGVTSAYGTFGMSSGKWYFEYVVYANGMGGISGTPNGASYPGQLSDSYAWDASNAGKYNNGIFASYGNATSNGDIVGVAFDADAGTLVFYKTGVSQGTAYSSIPSKTYFPVFRNANSGGNLSINFGQRPFAYTAPSGFKALCTQNLPTPTIGATATTQANKYFDVVLRTSNGNVGGTYSTTVNMSNGAWMWDKSRSNNLDHYLLDSVRGISKTLSSNTAGAEANYPNWFTNFGSSSFTTGSDDYTAGVTVVDWIWAANGSGSTNNAGSIQSTVSANTTSGFSIVSYTGDGNSGATVGHGLGAIPDLIIIRRRSGDDWFVYHKDLTSSSYGLRLNKIDAESSNTSTVTARSSTTFTIGTDGMVNVSSNTYIAYCFAPVAGYSAFGKYVANGSTDGNFIYTDMAPRFVLIKCSSTAENWVIFDTARDTYNVAGKLLRPNLSDAELDSPPRIDILSNGFKIRAAGTSLPNTSGATYIYMALAANPFKYSLAR
jgi:hypothetical protein